jgi:multiple sugar transport system ATP-binding protein
MAGVRFEQVSKVYGAVAAVRDLTLDIADGEFLVLVGPSGCGKSTTLRLLAGLEAMSSGRIFIGDRLVNDVPARDRDIAMVFQSYALYPHMSVFDNMAFGLKLRGAPKSEIRKRVENAAKLLGIDDLLARKPGQLSGGQRQRVALGRAMVRDPAAFLLDEPLSNLDARLRVQTRIEIKKLHQRLGTTFVYVTHDQVEAMTMATRVAVLNAGVLQQSGSPQELYDHPRNLFVAGFIGSPAMNFLEAEVHDSNSQLCLTSDGLELPVQQPLLGLLRRYSGKTIVIGIRPEHVYDAESPPAGIPAYPLSARVDVIEHLGNETLLHLVSAGGTPLLARVSPQTSARTQDTIRLLVDVSKLHAFDPETGLTITPSP